MAKAKEPKKDPAAPNSRATVSGPARPSASDESLDDLVADGVDNAALDALRERLISGEAVPRLVGMRLGSVHTTADAREVDTTVEATPSVLYDAVVLPPGVSRALASDGRVVEFLKDQYRHCKPLLVLGDARLLLEKTGIPEALPSGAADPGLVIGAENDVNAAIEDFVTALGKHRHFERETDPPRV